MHPGGQLFVMGLLDLDFTLEACYGDVEHVAVLRGLAGGGRLDLRLDDCHTSAISAFCLAMSLRLITTLFIS